MTAVLGYLLREEGPSRFIAVNPDGVEICGAYQPAGHNYWQLYVTKLVGQVAHVMVPPHREHFWGLNGRQDASRWVELIAALYVMASPAVGVGDGFGSGAAIPAPDQQLSGGIA